VFRDLLAAEFGPYGVLSEHLLDQLESHYHLLARWNQRLNLTRIADLEDAVRLHYCESLFLALHLPTGALRIADVGSGAGFPGIPVAIMRPESLVDLIESHQRKAVFLREASRELPGVSVIPQRAEEVSGNYDWTISRGVRPFDVAGLGIASDFALLLGESDAFKFPGDPLRMPWGNGRYLVKFHVEQTRHSRSGIEPSST
jgi:16S rRNA G527 N7-methylase RsmG